MGAKYTREPRGLHMPWLGGVHSTHIHMQPSSKPFAKQAKANTHFWYIA